VPTLPEIPMAFRDDSLRVVEVAALRRLLSYEADLVDPVRDADDPDRLVGMPAQTGSAALAVEMLCPPWRQVWDDERSTQPSGPHPVGIEVRHLAEEFDAGDLATLQGELR
jgi:hypothetical protein